MSVVILQDEIVHYEVLGRGRPLIFLHGWVGSWRYWIQAMQSASFSFRAYALDFWGFGDTAKNASRYSIQDQLNLLDAFMDQMGIAKTALIGHGLGGMIAIQYATQHPNLVDRVMAISVPLNGTIINTRLKTAPPAELAEWLLGKIPASEAARTEAVKADQQASLTSFVDLDALNTEQLYLQLPVPCLFVHGQNDGAIAAPLTDDTFVLPEHTHYIPFDQSSHFPMLEETSKFNRLLVDFLSLPSGESPRQLQLKEEWKRRVR